MFKSTSIPVKLYVKKFIEEGNNIRPYLISLLYTIFENQPTSNTSDSEISLTEYQYMVSINLPQHIRTKYGTYLSRKKVVAFNEAMEGYIKDRFECELQANIRRSKRQKEKFSTQEMILDLRKELRLDEENLPFETIKKSLQRFCDRENIDLEDIKIYKRNVPKSKIKSAGECSIPLRQFLNKTGMSRRNFFYKKKQGCLPVEVVKLNGKLRITINSLPPGMIS